MRDQQQRIASLDLAVAVVTFGPAWLAEAYVAETNLPWPLLLDEQRSLFDAYGMGRGDVWNVWGPPAWGAYFKLFAKGRMLKRPHGDVNQLGGDVLIDPEGIVRLHHVGKGPADRPPVERLLAMVESRRA